MKNGPHKADIALARDYILEARPHKKELQERGVESERNLSIAALYFGLQELVRDKFPALPGKRMDQAELSARYGITRSRVSAIVMNFLKRAEEYIHG